MVCWLPSSRINILKTGKRSLWLLCVQPDGSPVSKPMITSFKYTVFALEVIAHNMHHDECPEQFYGCWQTKTRTDASGLLKAISDFDFIVTFICAYSCLSHMSGLTVKLQKKTNDIFKAFSMVTEVKATYKRLRANLPLTLTRSTIKP